MQCAKVLCEDYNGYKDVLFMTQLDDFRLADKKYGYTLLATGTYDSKKRTFTVGKSAYYVYADWSIKPMAQHIQDWSGKRAN